MAQEARDRKAATERAKADTARVAAKAAAKVAAALQGNATEVGKVLTAQATPKKTATNSGAPILGKGTLRQMVAEYLQANEGSYGPSQIAKALERSAGAVRNACDTLVEREGASYAQVNKPGEPMRFEYKRPAAKKATASRKAPAKKASAKK
jgi:hypothetical protein